MFRIRSLSRRINDLEAEGHLFSREQAKDTTGQRYVRYHYIGRIVAPVPPPMPSGGVARGALGLQFAGR